MVGGVAAASMVAVVSAEEELVVEAAVVVELEAAATAAAVAAAVVEMVAKVAVEKEEVQRMWRSQPRRAPQALGESRRHTHATNICASAAT